MLFHHKINMKVEALFKKSQSFFSITININQPFKKRRKTIMENIHIYICRIFFLMLQACGW